jgi:hypothetical protein
MSERKFKVSMLEYSKIILSKFTFDKKLFIREYKKAFKYLDKNERVALRNWVRSEWRLLIMHRSVASNLSSQ